MERGHFFGEEIPGEVDLISAASKIRIFIDELSTEAIFTSGDVLRYGSRSAVDNELYEQVRNGKIKRLARGVFKKVAASYLTVTTFLIAQAKARRFGKEISIPFSSSKRNEGERIFWTNGGSTSFDSIHGRIYFRARPRKFTQSKAPIAVKSQVPTEQCAHASVGNNRKFDRLVAWARWRRTLVSGGVLLVATVFLAWNQLARSHCVAERHH